MQGCAQCKCVHLVPTAVPSQLLRQNIVHGADGTSSHVMWFGTQHCQTTLFSAYLVKWSISVVCGNGGRGRGRDRRGGEGGGMEGGRR